MATHVTQQAHATPRSFLPKSSEVETLYGGEVELTLDRWHRYMKRETVIDSFDEWTEWERVPGVTSVCKAAVNKSDQIGQWMANCARDKFLELIEPDTIYYPGMIARMANEMRYAHKTVSREACEIGKVVHSWIEKVICGWPSPVEMSDNTQVESACIAARSWMHETGFEPISQPEMKVYSREWNCAGTIDVPMSLARTRQGVILIDWKTMKPHFEKRQVKGAWVSVGEEKPYAENVMQVCAYAKCLQEMGVQIDGLGIVRLDKETGEAKYFDVSRWRDKGTRAFAGALRVVALLEELKQV